MAEDFIQSPPDSTGKRVHTKEWNDGTNDINTPVMMLGDRDNPLNRQSVDNQGAATVRYADGSPDFDIFGRMTVSELNLMGVYKFYEDEYASEFMKTEVGTGTVTHDMTNRGLKLECGTADGDIASYKSHRFYNYRPLNDMPLHFTFTSSPAVVGRTREIGWYTNCGDRMVFEEVDGVMNILLFDNLSNRTIRVAQDAWSGDRLDGSGDANNLSGVNLNAQKGGIWWISFQYLSMGIIDFGQLINGTRVLCHRIENYNQLDRPYMKSASVCFGFTQTNTAICGSSGSFTVHCATVTNDGYDDFIHSQSVADNKVVGVGATWVPIVSFRPSQFTDAGDDNRGRTLPRMISVLSSTSAIELRTDFSPTLTGDTWASTAKRTEFDTAATAVTVTDDTRLFGRVVAAGIPDNGDLSNVFDVGKNGVTRKNDASLSDYMTISARLFNSGDAVTTVGVTATLWTVE